MVMVVVAATAPTTTADRKKGKKKNKNIFLQAYVVMSSPTQVTEVWFFLLDFNSASRPDVRLRKTEVIRGTAIWMSYGWRRVASSECPACGVGEAEGWRRGACLLVGLSGAK